VQRVVAAPYKSVNSIITGQVTNANGEKLNGVSVSAKGTTTGTSTDAEGQFRINMPDNGTLVFTFIGYETKEIGVTNQSTINVRLEPSATKLDEVVVTAFGISKERKGLVYSVSSVKGSEFTEARENNIANALTGKIAGVDATQVSSGPGGSSRVVIRGNGSFNSNQQPLYVINGLPINSGNNGAGTNTVGLNIDRGDAISSINPDDIETITVLKSGAAAALYGSQAANGVIVITTKSGRAQQGIGVEFNSNFVFGTPATYPNFQTEYGSGNDGVKPATQAAALSAGRLSYGAKVDGSPVIQFDGVIRPYSIVGVKNNINNFYRPSTDFVNTIAMSGGSNAINFRFSASELRSQAQTPNSTFKRKTANLALRSNLGKNNLIMLESTVQYNIENGRNRPGVGYAEVNSSWATYLLGNTVDIRSLAPGYDPVTGNEVQWNPVPAAPNPYFVVNRTGNSDDEQRFIGTGSARINILRNLFLKGSIAHDFSFLSLMDYVPIGTAFTPKGYLNTGQRQDTRTNMNLILNYNTEFLKDFAVNAFVGSNKERINNFAANLSGIDFVVPDFISYTNLATLNPATSARPYRSEIRSGTNSVFGSADINYKGMIFLSVTGRQDWFSTLSRANNSIFYPSVGTGFVLSDAVRMPVAINFLKLRASWAQVGSSTVAAESINRIYTFATGGFNGIPVQNAPNNLQNPNIKPLTVTTSEGGFEIQLFKNRLSLDVTYYNRVTTNDILQPAISATSGYLAGNQNVGKITNKGIELLLSGSPIRTNNFSWNVTYNFAYNQSKIVELAPGITNLTIGSGIGGVTIVNAVNLPYASILGWRIRKAADGTTVYNKTSGYEDRYQDYLGVANPPYTMGFTNNFRYKNFNLNVLLDGKFGAVAYSNLWQYAMRFGLTKNTLPGRDNGLTVQGVDQDGQKFSRLWLVKDLDTYYNNTGSAYHELSTFNTDFVKLRSLILNYTLPVNKLRFVKLQGATIGLVARNLAIVYRDKAVRDAGLDPEMQQTVANATGTAGTGEPRTRTIGVNLNVKF
ncbi:MAG: SusC/RagA family TonB-linked outer membrane protein, partial [Segetibacter sp.]